MRRILHCDMDSFYAAVHVRDDPDLVGLPVVIGGSPDGRGVIAAASYEARKFGLRSAMPSARAHRLCPSAVFIRPDFQRYRRESQAVFSIFHRFTPIVQPVSIDEAYLDVTDHLGDLPSATAVAQGIRRQIKLERRLTVSVGVGPNRLIAKIASDHDKPDGLTVVPPKRVQQFLDPLPVRCIPGVGPVTGEKLATKGWKTVRDLRLQPLENLEALLGRYGKILWSYSRGVDERPVRVHRERKSLSSEHTFGEDLETLEEMDEALGRLAEEVARGLARREISAGTITAKVRYRDFRTVTRSQTLVTPTSDPAAIEAVARNLLRRTEAGRIAVRLLGVGASSLVEGNLEQLSLPAIESSRA